MSSRQIQLRTLNDTQEIGKLLALRLSPGSTLALSGELGTGKTTVTRSIVAALGFTGIVQSPTFVLCNEYRLPSGVTIEHWDLYRLSALPDELREPPGTGVIRIIEWADKFSELSDTIQFTCLFTLKQEGEVLARSVEVLPFI